MYWLMTNVLPGFRQFRFPAKLFTFTSLGIAVLAGLGWDRLGERRRTRVTAAMLLLYLLLLTAALLAGVLLESRRNQGEAPSQPDRLNVRSVQCRQQLFEQ